MKLVRNEHAISQIVMYKRFKTYAKLIFIIRNMQIKMRYHFQSSRIA